MSPLHPLLSFLQRNLSAVCRPLQTAFAAVEYRLLDFWWAMKGYKKPTAEDAALVAREANFIFKSFERHRQARELVRSIRKYYPGARIVIADDSSKPLVIDPEKGNDVTVIQLPFNSGLSVGLNKALAEVRTPFMVRMDDDELLTRRVNIAEEIRFLHSHPEVDIVGLPCIDAMKSLSLKMSISRYREFDMSYAPLPLKVPHGTKIDENHIVFGKVHNIFLARTDSVRKVGWDDNIRMIDHHDFFFRAAGVLVSVISMNSVVFHNHNYFSPTYNTYRADWQGDAIYIQATRKIRRKTE